MKLLKTLNKASLGAVALVTTSAAAFAAPVQATTISMVQQNVKAAYLSGANILYAVAAIIGIMFIVAGLFKAKAHSYDVQGTSGHMKGAISMLVLGGCLIAIPLIMMIGHDSFFGTATQTITLPSEAGGINAAS